MLHFLKTLLLIIAIGFISFLPMQADELTHQKENPETSVNKENEVDRLYKSAYSKAKNKNFEDAIKDLKQALAIQESLTGKENADYVTILSTISMFYYYSFQTEQAIKVENEVLDIKRQIFGEHHPEYANSLILLAEYNSFLGNYTEAINLEKEILEIQEQQFSKESRTYAVSLSKLASYNLALGNHNKALEYITEALNIQERIIGKEHNDYGTSLHILASYHAQLGNFREAVELQIKVINIREKIFGKEHKNYAIALSNLASYYSDLGNFAEAIRIGTEALLIQEKILGKDHPDYATTIANLANYNHLSGNIKEAIRLESQALEIRENILGKDHPDYANSLLHLASYYFSTGDYIDAINHISEALKIYKSTFGKENLKYALCLNGLATYFSSIGNYIQAIRLGEEELEIRKRILGKDHPDYAQSLASLASYNFSLGNYLDAIKLSTEALEIYEKILGKDHPRYAITLNNLSLYISTLGDYTKAIELGTEALEIRERILGKEHPDYAQSLTNLASYYFYLGNYIDALRLNREALAIIERVNGKHHKDYAVSLNNLAITNNNLGYHAEAIKLGYETLEIFEKIFGTDHLNYAIAIGNLALYNYSMGNYTEAIKLGTDAFYLKESLLGNDHPKYIKAGSNLMKYFFKSNQNLSLENLSREINSANKNYIRSILSNLTINERTFFWKQQKQFYEEDMNRYAYSIRSDKLISDAYDATLLAKGLLLASDIEFSKIILESNDQEAIKLYEDMNITRRMLAKLYEKPVSERFLSTDSLEREASSLERQLLERSKNYGDFTRNMSLTWQDVQNKLKTKDVAVEFVSFPLENDSIIYAAYVILPDMKSPAMVPLFEAKELNKIKPSAYYRDSELARLVWSQLDEYISDAANVYFAPAGELYNIAIESLPHYNGEGLMSDFHNFYRLSSTRELAVTKVKNEYTQAALYGGMKFDTKESFLEKDMEKYPELKNRDFSLVNMPDSLDLRGGVKYLPGTAVEVDNIERYLQKTSVRPLLYKGLVGTEASFKSLSGRKVNLMHLATHGFYWTEKEVRRAKDISFLMLDNERGSRYFEDKALTRSGLLFSGANNALQGVAIPEDVEDGILTAKEIAGLDLRGLDLVVLSACQTGLGEITGDGVFGLQRGFKKAGANSILMSLWKVDDKATQMLMTKFYEEFLGGKSKYEALKSAQKYIREYQPKGSKNDRPYSDPKYWAAFILLDALN